MKRFPEVQFHTTWHSYMIDASVQEDGMDAQKYMRKRWGGDGWTHSMIRGAKADGLEFANWAFWPNTLHTHRLIQYGVKHNKGSEVKERVLVGLYEKGENVSKRDVLVRIGTELGLPDVEQYMMSDEGLAEVRQQDRQAKTQMNVSGVPYFIINDRYTLSGANPTEEWVKVFNQLLK